MSITLELPKLTDLKPRITVVGVGGAGGNAVNNMIAAGLNGVDFMVANTDAQALLASSAEHRIQLGTNLTEGLGAGSKPEIGEAAAEEAIDEIRTRISGTHMLFVAAGMGGGTGTGAAAVIARVARDLGILTVAVVTKPFQFEGTRRLRIAEAGIAELKKHVDTLIVIPNQNLFRIANERTTFAEAFVLADQVLYSGIACIVDLIVKEGLINLDLADVRTVLTGMGTAMMGTGEASGDRRAIVAAEEAISNPLLDEVTLKGAKGLLLSIIGGRDLTLYEVDEAASRVRQEVDADANIIVGATFDETLGDRVRVSIVASGMSRSDMLGPIGASPNTPPNWPAVASPARPGAPVPPPLPHALHPLPGAGGSMAASAHGTPASASHGYLAPAAAAAPQAPSPDQWHAPGGVYVEERSAQVVDHPTANRSLPSTAADESDYAPPSDVFVPQAPNEVRRPTRRMPEVDDFPAVGQREYRAKTAHATSPEAQPKAPMVYKAQPQAEPKKGSLLQRLMGGGRSREKTELAAKDGSPSDDLPDFFTKQNRSR